MRFAIAVSKTHGLLGLSDGTVTSSPGGINCGGTCSGSYDMGTVVTLTATPNLPTLIITWEGCDTSAGRSCTVTMRGAKNIIAHFSP
jgi:hypothetical protein